MRLDLTYHRSPCSSTGKFPHVLRPRVSNTPPRASRLDSISTPVLSPVKSEIHTDFLPLLHLIRIVPIQFIKLIRQLDDHRPPTPTRTRHPRHIRTNPTPFRPDHLTDRRRLWRPPIHPPKRLEPFQKALPIPRHKRRPGRRRHRRCARSWPGNFQNRIPGCCKVRRIPISFAQTGFLNDFSRGRGSSPPRRGAWFGRLVWRRCRFRERFEDSVELALLGLQCVRHPAAVVMNQGGLRSWSVQVPRRISRRFDSNRAIPHTVI